MKHLRVVVVVGLGLFAGVGVDGHHSFNEFYFEDESVSLEGEVVEFEFRNPHAVLHLQLTDATGQVVVYAAEWSNPNALRRSGVTADTLQPGDRVTVTGSPGKDPESHTMHLKGIERPGDGWRWAGRPGPGRGRGARVR